MYAELLLVILLGARGVAALLVVPILRITLLVTVVFCHISSLPLVLAHASVGDHLAYRKSRVER